MFGGKWKETSLAFWDGYRNLCEQEENRERADRDTGRIPRKEHSGKSDQLLQSILLLQMFVYVPGE